ncbi:SDR family oxidoreductase [Sphingomonas flavalba]|uniref:SDR family oxidoreductase n=1 Tax=Sphingomonas flavalba TaxID=2559804 RepID=UPI0039E0BA35
MDLGIAGRHALVCGGSRGLGRAAAEALAREGVHLTLVARDAGALTAAAGAISAEAGVTVDHIATDLTCPDARARLTTTWGEPDILVCNPGVRQTPADIHALGRDGWDFWMEAHFHAVRDLILAAVPGMCGRGFGRVVNISVSNIKFPQTGFAHSHAARAALAATIAAMVRDLAPHNVVINSVLPGFFDTEALRQNLHSHAERASRSYEAIVADRLARTPAGRFADPAECGALIAFLCSAHGGFITGQNIVNDGGVYQGLF